MKAHQVSGQGIMGAAKSWTMVTTGPQQGNEVRWLSTNARRPCFFAKKGEVSRRASKAATAGL